MAHRDYTDSDGVPWQVWEVIPQSVERRKLRERRVAARDEFDRRRRDEARLRLAGLDVDGWLVFESFDAKKRLRPIPQDWSKASEVELESMCARAEFAARTSRRLIE
ncbi:MAG: hypothetical protein ABI664_10670 [bacterium]